CVFFVFFFFSSRRRHTRFSRDWSSDVCSSDLHGARQLVLEFLPDLELLVIETRHLFPPSRSGHAAFSFLRPRTPVSVSSAMRSAVMPQSRITASPLSPGAPGCVGVAAGLRLKRGAGAGC